MHAAKVGFGLGVAYRQKKHEGLEGQTLNKTPLF
jgi:hypothetical protein